MDDAGEVVKNLDLYGEMHRFIPAICKWRGARVTEEVVNHRPRVAGESKYGLKRTIKVLLDLITVKFLGDYLAKPIYFFGKFDVSAFRCRSRRPCCAQPFHQPPPPVRDPVPQHGPGARLWCLAAMVPRTDPRHCPHRLAARCEPWSDLADSTP